MDELTILASAFQASLDAKVIIDSDGTIYRINREAEKTFRSKDERELKGKSILSLVSGKSRNTLKEFISSLSENLALHQEIELKIQKDLKTFDVTGNANIIDDLSLLIFRDITEKVHEREAREQFIAIAGHELKTPLAVITAYTDLLQRKYKEDEALTQYLQKIENKTKVLTNYIESILDEIRIGAGKFPFEDKNESFDRLVYETIEELKKAYPNTKITIKGKTNKDVTVDRERIAQVMRNLVINAIKHTETKKGIKVTLKRNHNGVRFSVRDYGSGISSVDQSKIFRAFYRGGSDAKTKKQGLGLGLYIASQIINKYEGKIGVESERGKGSLFYFEIPI